MPTITLQSAPARRAWEAVRDLLTGDPDLRRIGIVWRLPDSTGFDDEFPTDRVACRLRPAVTGFGAIEYQSGYGKRIRETILTITVELSVPTEQWGDMGDVWAAMVRRLTGEGLQPARKLAHDQWLRDRGVIDFDLTPADWQQPGSIVVSFETES